MLSPVTEAVGSTEDPHGSPPDRVSPQQGAGGPGLSPKRLGARGPGDGRGAPQGELPRPPAPPAPRFAFSARGPGAPADLQGRPCVPAPCALSAAPWAEAEWAWTSRAGVDGLSRDPRGEHQVHRRGSGALCCRSRERTAEWVNGAPGGRSGARRGAGPPDPPPPRQGGPGCGLGSHLGSGLGCGLRPLLGSRPPRLHLSVGTAPVLS